MSLLALSWRRRTQQASCGNENNDTDSAPSSPLPPAVTASNSGETTHSSSHHHHDEETQTRPSATNSNSSSRNSNNNNNNSPPYIKLPLRTAPVTPDGLRPRQLASLIRQELQVPDSASVMAMKKQRPFLMEKKKNITAVLPPAPSSSWSIPNNLHHPEQLPYRVLTSPLISNSSFYSGNGQEEVKVAESPHLLPGQARTAVGALVALHSRQQQLESNTISSKGTGYDGDGSVEALHSSFQPLPQPTEWMRYHDDDEDDDDEGEEEIPPYHPLEQEPVNPLTALSPFRPEGRLIKNQMSPISTNSSILLGSPSSLAQRPYLMAKNSKQLADATTTKTTSKYYDDVNKSFSSAAGLIPRDYEQQQARYDFGHVAAAVAAPAAEVVGYTDVVYAHPSDQTHVSAMSNSITEHGAAALYGGGVNGSRSINNDDDYEDIDSGMYQHAARTPHNMDGALLRQKVQNQRRLREELVLAVVERLQDDVQLVADVEAVGHAAVVMADWFVKTPLDCPGILTGFSLQQRKTIIGHLTSVLNEMNVACPEDFFLSPSQVPGFAETHHDLCEALCFCLTLVQMAIPQEEQNNDEYQREQGKWKLLPGLRPTLGIIPPDTPEHARGGRGGGDTSVFTLPSDSAETPMTSNVSITTTIETGTRNMSSSSLLRHPFKHQPNGLQIRRTIEILSTLVQRMSVACQQLADMPSLQTEKSVRITKDIKNTYLQLIAMDHCDLRALVDAFELELLSSSSRPLMLTTLISTDDDEQQHQYGASAGAAASGGGGGLIIPPPNLERKSNARNSPVPEELLPGDSPQSGYYSESSSGTNLFSPSSEDMKSLKPFGQSHHGNVAVRQQQQHYLSDVVEDLRRGGFLGTSAGSSTTTSNNDHENENVAVVDDERLQANINAAVDCKFSFDNCPPPEEEEGDDDEFDDLRRLTGSTDHNNDEDEREGPEYERVLSSF